MTTAADPTRTLCGTGVHTGAEVRLSVQAGAAGSGVRFVRDGQEVPAHVSHVTSTDRRVQLGLQGTTIDTVEHLLAAAAGMGVADLVVHIDGPECPIGDGSALPYVDLMRAVGPRPERGEPFRLPEPFVLESGTSWYRYEPAEGLTLDVRIEFDHPLIGKQRVVYSEGDDFARTLAGARTFVRLEDVQALQEAGLIRGGSPDCAVVLTGDGVVHGSLRWPDECARHKTLDLLGDLSLLGRRCSGHITAVRPGHPGNVALVAALLERAGALSA